MIWALLGPSIILLTQAVAALVVADGFGLVNLSAYGHRTALLVAICVLVLVTAAELSVGFWTRARRSRAELMKERRRLDAGVFAERTASSEHSSPTWDSPRRGNTFLVTPARLLRALTHDLKEEPSQRAHARWVNARFGLEVTWAYEMLTELGVPAARQISRRLTLADVRAAGALTAFLLGVTTAIAVVLSGISYAVVWFASAFNRLNNWERFLLPASCISALVFLTFNIREGLARASKAYGRGYLRGEREFYSDVQRLLELHRFDLYRSLALQAPRDAREEREMPVADWRRGAGGPAYVHDDPQEGNATERQDGFTAFLRGPDLVPYQGFVSWEFQNDAVMMAFAASPLLADGLARVEVEGSATDRYAPFELTANSQDVALVEVRAAVRAPVDGNPAHVSFSFTRLNGTAADMPVIWIEVRQRGRFIRLLRVQQAKGGGSTPLVEAKPSGSE